MTEEIKNNADDIHPKVEEEPRPEAGTEEEPQVYSVNKGLTGWKFGRREFLAATATAAAAVTAAAMVATDKSGEAAPGTAATSGEALMLDVALPVMMAVQPAQSFAQTWRFTNKSKTAWCRGATLHLANADGYIRGDQLQAPASVTVPDIAPGETVNVKVDMMAPAELDTYRSSWRLQVADHPAPVASGPFVVLNGCIIESGHPYPDTSQAWPAVINPDSTALSTRVHFSRLELASGDYIVLKDSGGQERQRITGSYASGLWSNPVPGIEVRVELERASSESPEWGFCLDQVESNCRYLPIVFRQPTPTPTSTPTATPCACYGVCSCHGHCSCNPHCTCDRIHYWYPC